jgi:hypothetical protein
MEMIQREETSRLGVSEGIRLRIPIRICQNPFLGQSEGVMERIQWEETPRLGVSEGIRLRIGPSPFLGQTERVMERIPRRDWRFPKDKDKDNLRLHHHKIWLLKDRDKGKIHQS